MTMYRDNAMGTIYFIAPLVGGPIKVGFTRGEDLYTRLGGLALSCPFPLRLLATVAGTIMDETLIHNKLFDFRSHGEWFQSNPKLLALIESVKASAKLPKQYKAIGNEPVLMRRTPKSRVMIAGFNA